MTKLLNVIADGTVEEASRLVFHQHFDHSSENGYTCPLSSEEETALIQRFLVSGDETWLDFIKLYVEKLPLSTTGVRLLIANLAVTECRNLLITLFMEYGHNQDEGLQLCKIFSQENFDDWKLLECFCTNARIYYENIYNSLALLDAKWAKLYKSTVENYHSA